MTTHRREIHIEVKVADTTNCHSKLLGGRTNFANSPDHQRAGRAEKKNALSAHIRNPSSSFLIFTVLIFHDVFVAIRDPAYVYISYNIHIYTLICLVFLELYRLSIRYPRIPHPLSVCLSLF